MFSNFSSFTVEKEGVLWVTAEHLFQASKFMDRDSNKNIIDEIKNSKSAYDAKRIAHKYPDKVRSDWNDIKVEIMDEIIKLKHNQHKHIQEMLQDTGDRIVIENSPEDSFWGWGPDRKGRNELGKAWMRLREELK